MMDRINGVAEPDINVFNVAKPDKARLSVFSHFCPLDAAPPDGSGSARKNVRRKRKHSARVTRNQCNRALYDCDWEEYYDDADFAYQPNARDYA